jgi:predicted DNA repair protein MutK
MASGLLALLDDIAAIAKVAAASVDDVAALSGKATAKAAGVVIDDAAVTPRYVVGFSADRELPIVWKIALGSLRNKLLILLPVALALSAFAPWLITPLLVLGGLYLCFEGAEKLLGKFLPHHQAEKHAAEAAVGTPEELERSRVAGAIRTDFILSAEIMAITLASLPEGSFAMRAAVLGVVAVLITVGVYGVVALIVKADDVGVRLAQRGDAHWVRALGRGIVAAMPVVLAGLAVVGTVAMLWVGGGIVLHGLEEFGFEELPHLLHGWEEAAGGALGWLMHAAVSGVVGLILGGLIVGAVSALRPARPQHA